MAGILPASPPVRLYRFRDRNEAVSAVLVGERLAPLRRIAPEFPDLDALVQGGGLPRLRARLRPDDGPAVSEVELLAPLARPPKIWCVGLNFRAHAEDLDAALPPAPVGFMRPTASLIGPGEPVRLPRDAARVTGEGELALVLGRTGCDFGPAETRSAVAAWTLAVDMTAEDILRENPRFLTRAKSYDTFLSMGPCLVTPGDGDDGLPPPDLEISTLWNGEPKRAAPVGRMRHSPERLLEFFSRNMTWRAGDILLTGTPGAVRIEDGDVIGAEAPGIGRIENPVRRA